MILNVRKLINLFCSCSTLLHLLVSDLKGLTVFFLKMIFFSQDNVSNAKQRIILASLYLGTGAKEKQLVSVSNLQSY